MKKYRVSYPFKVQYGRIYPTKFQEGQIVDEGMIAGLFEEIKKELKCECPCSECVEFPSHGHLATNGICPMFCQPTEREECKHFLPLRTFTLFGWPVDTCRHCEETVEKPTRKPSLLLLSACLKYEEDRRGETDLTPNDITLGSLRGGLCDFLDEHFKY